MLQDQREQILSIFLFFGVACILNIRFFLMLYFDFSVFSPKIQFERSFKLTLSSLLKFVPIYKSMQEGDYNCYRVNTYIELPKHLRL